MVSVVVVDMSLENTPDLAERAAAAQVWSPRRKVLLLAEPEPRRAVGTVPLAKMEVATSCPPPAESWWLWLAFARLAMVGVTIVGEVALTTLPVPVESLPKAVKVPLASGKMKVLV